MAVGVHKIFTKGVIYIGDKCIETTEIEVEPATVSANSFTSNFWKGEIIVKKHDITIRLIRPLTEAEENDRLAKKSLNFDEFYIHKIEEE